MRKGGRAWQIGQPNLKFIFQEDNNSGFGFELRSVVPNVPKTAEKAEALKAA
jgi:hypothetical protein